MAFCLFLALLHSSPSRFKSFVKEFVVPPRLADLLIEGIGQMVAYRRNRSLFVGCSSFKMLALRIDLADFHRFWFKP